MHIEVHPAQFVEFRFIPNERPRTVLSLKNIHPGGLCFNIKTTSPKYFIVAPSRGFLEDGGSREIEVVMVMVDGCELQDFQKHKFLIQTCPTPLNATTAVSINEILMTSPKEIQSLKLSVKLIEGSSSKSSPISNSAISDRSDSKFEINVVKDFQEKHEVTKSKLEEEYSVIMNFNENPNNLTLDQRHQHFNTVMGFNIPDYKSIRISRDNKFAFNCLIYSEDYESYDKTVHYLAIYRLETKEREWEGYDNSESILKGAQNWFKRYPECYLVCGRFRIS